MARSAHSSATDRTKAGPVAGKRWRLARREAPASSEKLTAELGEIQEELYAAGQHSVLMILQGIDTSGKDGTIRNVARRIRSTVREILSAVGEDPDREGLLFAGTERAVYVSFDDGANWQIRAQV